MNWLITGGCGFIGRNLVKKLQDDGGHYIRVIDNLIVGDRQDLAAVCSYEEIDTISGSEVNTVDLLVGDILDENLALAVTKDCDIIVHLAANTGVAPSVMNPRFDCQTNILGTLNYLEAARKNSVSRFVFASSGAPVGECDPPIHEELPSHPVSPYGASKLAGEAYCSAYYRSFGVDTIALRFGNVYGPFSKKKSSVVAKFIRLILEDKDLVIYGDGTQTRDFIYIDDLVGSIVASATKPEIGGEIFQIATAKETSVQEIAILIAKNFEESGFKREIMITHEGSRLGDVKRNFSDTTKAEQKLGWKADVVLEAGLKRTIEWFRNQAL